MTIEVARTPGVRLPRGTSAARLRALVESALALGGRPGLDVGIVLCDDPTLARLHERWLADPSPTDVIAFDLGSDASGPAGEIYVSVERARSVAARRGLEAAREVELYAVHGALHLCGHDDVEASARRRMRRAEKRVFEARATRSRSTRRRARKKLPS